MVHAHMGFETTPSAISMFFFRSWGKAYQQTSTNHIQSLDFITKFRLTGFVQLSGTWNHLGEEQLMPLMPLAAVPGALRETSIAAGRRWVQSTHHPLLGEA